MYDFCVLFMLFFSFSVFGWIGECISCTINTHKFTYNRGFLLGPYCPIYGVGALYTYYFIANFNNDPVLVFIISVILTSILEYFTSYLMEKIFKARWWDYSDRFFNINGRICLRNAFIFGISGIAFTYLVKPSYINIISSIPHNIFIIISIALLVVFIIDYIASFTATYRIRSGLMNALGDSTSEIDKRVRKVLAKHRFQVKKMLKSFPNLTIVLPNGEKLIKTLKKVLDSMDLRKIIKEKE